MDFTAAIGADTVLLATHEERGSVDTYADVYARALRPIADAAAAAGVTLAFEHVGRYIAPQPLHGSQGEISGSNASRNCAPWSITDAPELINGAGALSHRAFGP